MNNCDDNSNSNSWRSSADKGVKSKSLQPPGNTNHCSLGDQVLTWCSAAHVSPLQAQRGP